MGTLKLKANQQLAQDWWNSLKPEQKSLHLHKTWWDDIWHIQKLFNSLDTNCLEGFTIIDKVRSYIKESNEFEPGKQFIPSQISSNRIIKDDNEKHFKAFVIEEQLGKDDYYGFRLDIVKCETETWENTDQVFRFSFEKLYVDTGMPDITTKTLHSVENISSLGTFIQLYKYFKIKYELFHDGIVINNNN